jgi:hypothetical protein
MNSLRVGIVDVQCFASFDFLLVLPDGPTYTPDSVPGKRPSCFWFEPAEFRALIIVEKLYLASKNGKRYNLQPP